MKLLFISLLSFVLINSCAGARKSLREHNGTYLESVRLNFQAGEDALKKEDFEKAIAYFQFVRSKYPSSQYAALSDLAIADTKYAQKKYLDAASAYEIFIRLHPRHEKVAYASYKLGSSYFYAIPKDFFLWPNSSSRDQSFTKEALSAIERFIYQFPGSPYEEEALRIQAELFSKLARASQEVAAFYVRTNRYEAALKRFLSVDELYPEAKESSEALYQAAQLLQHKLKEPERALEIYRQIVEQKPDSAFLEQAKRAIGILEGARES